VVDKRKKGVIFDMDGTLTRKGPSVWATIDEHAISAPCRRKLDALRERYLQPAIDGTLSVQGEIDWLIGTLDAYVQDGLASDTMQSAIKDMKLRAGVVECMRMLDLHGIPVAIVSYGIAQAIETILRANGVPIEHSLYDAIFAARLTGTGRNEAILYTGYDEASLVIPSNKGEWSEAFASRHNVRVDNLLAVGDSGGDRFLCPLKKNRLGLAGDAKEAMKLQKFMGTVIVTDDFSPVTAWIAARLGL